MDPPAGKPPIGADRHPLCCDLNKSGHFMEIPRAILKGDPYPARGLIILIHPQDAEKRGIQNGDRKWVETLRGKVPFYAKVTDRIMKGVVEANMGGGGAIQPKEWKEAKVNELTDPENRDPISGFPVFKALLCEVKAAKK